MIYHPLVKTMDFNVIGNVLPLLGVGLLARVFVLLGIMYATGAAGLRSCNYRKNLFAETGFAFVGTLPRATIQVGRFTRLQVQGIQSDSAATSFIYTT
jgi:hypothetical protein